MKSKILLVSGEFEHIQDGSYYNHNYYRHKNNDKFVIYEVCNEEYNYYEFYSIEQEEKIFLGSSSCGLSMNNPEHAVEIDFKVLYT